jgi:PTS system nitrogen regulatory IIA component
VTKIETFLSAADAQVDVRAPDKERLLKDLSARAATVLNLEAEDINRQVTAREALGSTGMGEGIGLPHARIDSIASPYGILSRLKKPMEFDAVDGQPVDLVVFLLLPSTTPDENLNTLASIARKLREPERLKRMRQAPDGPALLQELLT